MCIRLYGEEDFVARPEFTEPEILRTNLASVILQMAALGLGDMAAFPFVEPPDARSIKDGVLLLEELGARDRRTPRRGRLTPSVAASPASPPTLAWADGDRGRPPRVRAEVLVVAAALSIQDPRERPSGKRRRRPRPTTAASRTRGVGLRRLPPPLALPARPAAGRSDRARSAGCAGASTSTTCGSASGRTSTASSARSRSASGCRSRRSTDEPGPHRDPPGRCSRASCRRSASSTPTAASTAGARGAVRDRSGLGSWRSRRPAWVMAAELVETNRLWARTVAQIEPGDIEKVAGHLVTRSYEDPWWDEERGEAMTTERVSLYGLPVVTGRRKPVEQVDRGLARALFLRHARRR